MVGTYVTVGNPRRIGNDEIGAGKGGGGTLDPLFGLPLVRRTVKITQKSVEYCKKVAALS